jgi:hypothetical protein
MASVWVKAMFPFAIRPAGFGHSRPSREHALRTMGLTVVLGALLCTSLVVALEALSKPFLDKNSFYLSSAGFRIQIANDPATKKAMHALPPHRFVLHRNGDDARYLFAEPQHCVCIFIGTRDAYQSYRDMLGRPSGVDPVDADYRSQASAMLNVNPEDFNLLPDTTGVADILRLYY